MLKLASGHSNVQSIANPAPLTALGTVIEIFNLLK